MITDFSQLDLSKRYTYADYVTWLFEDRVELIKGWIYKMSPAPKRRHQEVSLNLTLSFASYFKTCGCKVYEAPFDVRLKRNKDDDNEVETVVQPDISVFCDLSKLDDRGAIDAPDLVVEVTSDSTMKRDYNDKFKLYEENFVQEYWIVNPEMYSMELFSREGEILVSQGVFNIADGKTKVKSQKFPEFEIDLEEIFKD
jgi:Uma2 family endonuclease